MKPLRLYRIARTRDIGRRVAALSFEFLHESAGRLIINASDAASFEEIFPDATLLAEGGNPGDSVGVLSSSPLVYQRIRNEWHNHLLPDPTYGKQRMIVPVAFVPVNSINEVIAQVKDDLLDGKVHMTVSYSQQLVITYGESLQAVLATGLVNPEQVMIKRMALPLEESGRPDLVFARVKQGIPE
jgi:hypothetical protein